MHTEGRLSGICRARRRIYRRQENDAGPQALGSFGIRLGPVSCDVSPFLAPRGPMRFLRLVLFITALSVGTSDAVRAQSPFTDCLTGTASNATIIISETADLGVSGRSLTPGDEIAVLRPGGRCVGVVVWTGGSVALTIWGGPAAPGATADSLHGLHSGDSMVFAIYNASTDTVYSSAHGPSTVRFQTEPPHLVSDNRYVPDGIYRLVTLHVSTAHAERE